MSLWQRLRFWRALPRSAITSILTTIFDFAVLSAAVEIFHVNYVFATWLGTVVGSLSNFTINKHWAFRGSAVALPHQLGRFVLVQLGASLLHTGGVWLMTGLWGLPYQVSKLVIAVVVALAWNYPLNHKLVFATAGTSAAPGTVGIDPAAPGARPGFAEGASVPRPEDPPRPPPPRS